MAKIQSLVNGRHRWRVVLALAISMWAGWWYFYWNSPPPTVVLPSLPDGKDLSYHRINALLDAHQDLATGIPIKKTISWLDFIKRPDADSARGAHELVDAENIALLRSVSVLARCSPTGPTGMRMQHGNGEGSGTATSQQCAGAWDAAYLAKWLAGQPHGHDSAELCESLADSEILVLDSPMREKEPEKEKEKEKVRLQSEKPGKGQAVSHSSSRYFSLRNVMLDLNKMRQQRGRREFEVGLISASCGATAREELAGLPLYVPDIANQYCDYVFDEPVLLVSHDSNTVNGGKALRDAYAVFTALLLSGYATLSHSKRVTLLNIQGLLLPAVSKRHNIVVNDREEWRKPRNYHYRKLFRRVLGAGDFPSGQRLCFKQLIVLNKPPLMLPWGNKFSRRDVGMRGGGGGGTSRNSSVGCLSDVGSELSRQWNVQMRQLHQLLPSVHYKQTLPVVTNQRLHVVLTIPTGSGSAASNYALQIRAELEDLLLDFGQDADFVQVSSVDFANLPLPDQVYIAGNASILVGLSGSDALWSAAFMPLGTALCCGIVELDAPAVVSHSFSPLAGFLGIYYGMARTGTPKSIAESVLEIARKLHEKPSCV